MHETYGNSVSSSAGVGVKLPLEAAVQYYSRSAQDWVAAKVKSHSRLGEGFYSLDIQPMAAVQRVRPVPPGTDVYYWSNSAQDWIQAVVKSYNWEHGIYVTDVQPCARPWMIRERRSEHAVIEQASQRKSNITKHPSTGYSESPGNALMPKEHVRAPGDQTFGSHPQAISQSGPTMPDSHRQTAKEELPACVFRDPPAHVARRFKCPLCLEDAELEQGVSLDCDHKLCVECFGDYCRSKIGEGRVMENELVCPATDEDMKICGKAITVEQVRGNIASELFDKFCSFRAANWVPNDDDGVLVKCPTPDCCAFMVSLDLNVAKCPTCKQELCTFCSKPSHKDETCEAAALRRKQDASESDKQFDKLLLAQGWMRCPSCETPTELARGCYFMQCQSDTCRGRTHFCYLCGDLLKGEDHAPGRSLAHFPRGPYNAECVKVSEAEYRKRMENAGTTASESANPVEYLLENARRYLEF